MNPNPIPDYIKDKIRQQANTIFLYLLSQRMQVWQAFERGCLSWI
jgi:hypothetical protein